MFSGFRFSNFMNMLKRLLILFIISFSLPKTLDAQLIVAGNIQPTDYHYDYAPDTSIYVSGQVGTNQVPLDINRDGIIDFYIQARYHIPWNWGEESSFMIEPVGNAQVAGDYFDTCFTLDSVPLIGYISGYAKAYHVGESIDRYASWSDTVLFCKQRKRTVNQPMGSQGPDCSNMTIDTVYSFFGLRVITTDTFYGWIRMKQVYGILGISPDTLRVDRYVCQTVVSGIAEAKGNPVSVFYPNPGAGIFYCDKYFDDAFLEIRDLQGRILFSRKLDGEHPRIDLSAQPEGVYLAYIRSEEGDCMQRLVVCH